MQSLKHRGLGALAVVACAAMALAACGSAVQSTSTQKTPSTAASGGSLTVLEGASGPGAWPAGFDPATTEAASANATQMDAIYGELFEIGASENTIGDLATGYKLSANAKTLTVYLRKGVVFSNGAPFNASAVVWNWTRDFKSKNPGLPPWPGATFTTPNAYTVVVHLAQADGAVVNQFQATIVNWIASPTAEEAMGEKAFAEKPVGAGPFEVVSDTFSAKLVLQRNPHYWQKGLPYLDKLTFEATATDESALEDLESGAAQAYEGMATPGLVKSYKGAGLQVTAEESASPYTIEFNTAVKPFSNILAREAVYYATNAAVIDRQIYGDVYPTTESFTTGAGLFYEPKVPGYRTYNLADAKKLVKRAGGVSFDLFAIAGGDSLEILEALQTMYEDAGMKVKISDDTLDEVISKLASKKWQVNLGFIGDWDPAAAGGICKDFCPATSEFAGSDNTHLIAVIDAAAAATSETTRAKDYREAAEIISQEAYTPFLFPYAVWNIAAKGVHGPGLTTLLPDVGIGPAVEWQDVRR